MRRAVLICITAACGGPPPAPSHSDRGANNVQAQASTTGFPGVDWTTDRSTLLQKTGAENDASGIQWHTMHEGRGAVVVVGFDADRATSIDVVFDDVFAGPDACKPAWSTIRTSLDRQLGPSSSDNLTAQWTLPTAAITLRCNPSAAGEALIMMYAPHRHD